MWTQIERTNIDNNPTPVGAQQIVVISVNNISIGNWVVIEPLSPNCEIRKVFNIAGLQLEFYPGMGLNHSHPADAIIYCQTSPNWDILLFGAEPTNNASAATNTLAINNAIIDCNFNGGGIVSIPKGEYFIERTIINSIPQDWAVCGINIANIKFIGEGIAVSKIIRNTDNNDWGPLFLFFLGDAINIDFQDLTIDGNNDNTTLGFNISSCIQISMGNNININRTSLEKSIGYSLNAALFGKISITNSFLSKSLGYGVSMVNSHVSNVIISRNTFESNELNDIFFSRSVLDPFNMFIISENIFNRSTSNASYSLFFFGDSIHPTTSFYEDFEIVNNIFTNGAVYFENCKNLVFSNNILNTENNAVIINSYFTKQSENIVFENNVVVNKNDVSQEILFSSYDNANLNEHSSISGILVSGNTFQNTVCKFRNVKDVLYASNQEEIILTATPPAPFDSGFYFLLDQAPELYNPDWHDWGNVTIANNQLNGKKKTGISFYKNINIDSAKFKILSITGNLIAETENYGIIIDAINHQPYWNRALIATSNMINNIPYNYSNDLTTILVCGSYITEENPNQEIWISRGDPNGLIEAPQGSLAIDNSIEADNKYQKNTLDGSNGWTLVSELDKQLLFEEFFLFQTQVGATPPYHLAYQESIAPNLNILYAPPSPPGPPVPTPWMYPNGVYFSWDVTQYQRATIHNTGVHNIAVIDATADNTVTGNLPDCIVKAIFYNKDLTVTGEGVGLCLRYDDNNSNSRNYWVFYVKNTNTPGMMELHLEKVVNNVTTVISLPINTVAIGRSKMFKLKAVLQGNFVSVFYNDLLIVTVEDSINNTNHKHGIYGFGNPNHFYCEQFKILIS